MIGSLSHRGLCCYVPVMKRTLAMQGGRDESILGTDSRTQMQHFNHNGTPQRSVKGYTWMGEQSLLDTECLAEQNGGLYIGVESEDDLAKALERTLGCPVLSQRASP